MDEPFWRAIWQGDHQGFHEGRPNAFLTQHITRFQNKKRVLVPLCGKSEDLLFLRNAGLDVVGIELVEDAARQFFADHALRPREHHHHGHLHLSADHITIIVANVLDVTREETGGFDVMYDRAAAVALPATMRTAYARAMQRLLDDNAHLFLITFVHPHRTSGPSVQHRT